jgi:large subunit ribosomal protein L14e
MMLLRICSWLWNSFPCRRRCASGSAAPLGYWNAASSPPLLCCWFALDACCFSFLFWLVLPLACAALVQALVDGPASLTGVSRQTIPFRNLSLTSIKLEIPRAVRTGTLTKAFTKADVLGQWQKSSWAKKLARHQTRSELGDFDRFKLMLLRKKKSLLINREFAKLRRAANPQAKKAASAKKPAAAKKA